ncbi:MAG: fibronectin type III domain-containing protein, partial [Paludibacteraceae bacterium]|nr:fibronectin type III domain-containing protein [Paludibacteraceae bacterium]
MRKKIFSLAVMLMALLTMPMAVNAETLLVNDGTSTSSSVPIYGSYTDGYMNVQTIYPEAVLSAMNGKNITKLTFYHSSTSVFDFTGTFVVSLGISTNSTFSSPYAADETTVRTEVYRGQLSRNANGTFTIEFQSDYLYQGGNLLLDIRMAVSGNYNFTSFYGVSGQDGYSVYTTDYSAESPSYTNGNFAPKTTFTYETPSNCPKPSGITLGEVTTNTAAISWTENGTATSWRVFYSINGGAMDSADVTGTPAYTITGLNHSTTYTISGYVKANCGSEMSNQRDFSFSFDTECATPSTPAFYQDFEGAKFPPVCWSMTHVSGTSTADPYAINTSSTFIHSGSKSVRPCNSTNNEQILATGVLPIDSVNKYEVVMWIYRKGSTTSASTDDEGLKIYASSSATDTTGATLLGYVHGSCNRTPAEASSGYYKYNFPITTSGNKYLLIYSITRSSSPTYFDDVQVRKIPTCTDIQGFQTISDITTTTAKVAVHDNTVTAFDVAYGVQGTPIEECQIASFNDTIGTLTGLTPSLFYDTYIRRNCGADTGEWTTDKVTFRTLCVPVASMPFNEDFEGEPTGNLGGCYTVSSSAAYFPSVLNASSHNHTAGGSKVISIAYTATATSGTSVQGTYGLYRQFNLDATKAYKITAWVKAANANSPYDLIFLCDTTTGEGMQA